jgi:hypothetical protein
MRARGHVRALDNATESGGSQPHVFEADDGDVYMVKASNNPQGPRVLANELLGGLCLDWLGVAHPSPAVIELPQEVIDASPGAKFNDGTPLASGKAFGSPVWQSDPQAAVGADLLLNSEDIAGTEAADGWLRNHNGRQYRVRRSDSDPGRYEFIPVDQGHLIGNPEWSADSVRSGQGAPIQLSSPKPLSEKDVEPTISRLRQFDRDAASHIVEQIPAEWATSEEKEALVDYLVARAAATVAALESKYPREAT